MATIRIRPVGTRGEKTRSDKRFPLWLISHHPLASRYLQTILRRATAFEVFASGTIVDQQSLQGRSPSIVIMDLEFLPHAFPSYIHSLRSFSPDPKVLIVASSISDEDLCRALFLGIQGFIPYESVDRKLILAVQRISEGHLMVSPEMLEKFALYASKLVVSKTGARPLFSSRQKVTLNLLQRRMSNKEIAGALRISERTVKFHLANIFSKLGVNDRHSAVNLLNSIGLAQEFGAQEIDPAEQMEIVK